MKHSLSFGHRDGYRRSGSSRSWGYSGEVNLQLNSTATMIVIDT
jgi:hypothetical protein